MLASRAHSPWQLLRHVAPRTAALPSMQVRPSIPPCLLKTFGNPLQMRQVHDEPTPFSGPPSYATLHRRFSSQPNPVAFFEKKKVQEAAKRGEFDIHDIGGVDPKDFDVLITDLSDNKLRSDVADIIGIPYLQRASEDEASQVVNTGRCFVYGSKYRTIMPCVVSTGTKGHWVFFVVDTGAPLTYLSQQAAQVLGIERNATDVMIAGRRHPVHISPALAHFSDINILGADFYILKRLCLEPESDDTVTFHFRDALMQDVKPKL